MMGSEQRRLNGLFGLKAASDAQEVVRAEGLREEYEPHPPCVELLLSPASPSPSKSVLSYAESWCRDDRDSVERDRKED